MKRRVFFYLTVLLMTALVLAGCAPAPVNEHDLEKVNFYAQSSGAETIDLVAAEEMNQNLLKNTETGAVKTSWQLVVDYVINANNEEPEPLDYAIEFEGTSYTLADESSWEKIGE